MYICAQFQHMHACMPVNAAGAPRRTQVKSMRYLLHHFAASKFDRVFTGQCCLGHVESNCDATCADRLLKVMTKSTSKNKNALCGGRESM